MIAQGEVGWPTGRVAGGGGGTRLAPVPDGAKPAPAPPAKPLGALRRAGDRPRRGGGCALGHHELGRHALFEDDDDAVAPAAGRQDVDRVALAGAAAEEDADGVHAAGLEDVGRGTADATPQAAPFGDRAGDDLLGLAGDRRRALPMASLDGLGGSVAGRQQQSAGAEDAIRQEPPTRQVINGERDCLSV